MSCHFSSQLELIFHVHGRAVLGLSRDPVRWRFLIETPAHWILPSDGAHNQPDRHHADIKEQRRHHWADHTEQQQSKLHPGTIEGCQKARTG